MTNEQKFLESWTPDLKNENGEFYRSEKVAIILFEYAQKEVKNISSKLMLPAVFLSGKDKAEQFQKELKALLSKYDAELIIEDFGRDLGSDKNIVVNFSWDEDLANRTNDGTVPRWVVGRWENGS